MKLLPGRSPERQRRQSAKATRKKDGEERPEVISEALRTHTRAVRNDTWKAAPGKTSLFLSPAARTERFARQDSQPSRSPHAPREGARRLPAPQDTAAPEPPPRRARPAAHRSPLTPHGAASAMPGAARAARGLPALLRPRRSGARTTTPGGRRGGGAARRAAAKCLPYLQTP
ncbi:translation initiation factor IF-2-like [Vidua chalybeata]|uniref:translation initiation factor IF-2-like n=1 Tax=Vidua chalybeata TaxID=81927 RepID=UPI0023A7B79E|nr:translation initiation factor IF-2-like [Vidua chalybeata]